MLWESFKFNFRVINSNYLGLIMSSSGPSAHQQIIFDLSCEELIYHGEFQLRNRSGLYDGVFFIS